MALVYYLVYYNGLKCMPIPKEVASRLGIQPHLVDRKFSLGILVGLLLATRNKSDLGTRQILELLATQYSDAFSVGAIEKLKSSGLFTPRDLIHLRGLF
jgi:hypothetical protein